MLLEKFRSFLTIKPDKKRPSKRMKRTCPANHKVDWLFEVDRENIFLIPDVSGSSPALILRVRSQAFRLGQPMPPQDSPNNSVKRLLPWLVAIAVFMESLDTTILNTAVPAIAEALKVAPLSMKAVLSSYTLSLAVFIPVSGWMADRYGTRRVFSSAIGIFTVGSVLCGISSSIHMLVACRILQGCGGAMMVPVGRLTMVRTFAKSELIRAMSFVAVPALIGPMLGPFAGGLIVGFLHWRMIFFINLPIGLLGLYLVYRHLPDYRDERSDKLDIIGLILFGSGVALLSYVLEVFGEHTLSGREVLGLLALSIVLLLGYGCHATTTAHPLLRLDLFRIRTFRAAVSGGFITRLGVGGMPFFFPCFTRWDWATRRSNPASYHASVPRRNELENDDAAHAHALWLSPGIALQHRDHGRASSSFSPQSDLARRSGSSCFRPSAFGFFSSLQYTSMNTLVYADVTESQTSMASTIASTIQQMSISFGVAVASLVTALFIPDRFHSDASQMIQGLHKAFIVLGALTVLSTSSSAS